MKACASSTQWISIVVIKKKPNQRLLALFREQSCWMIEPLAAEMKYSIPSVRRFLAEVGYFSSFTHNGSWYTLHSIPRFDGDGLWFFRDIGFSRSGSFTSTLIDLAARSPEGMTAETLGAKLRVRWHSLLDGKENLVELIQKQQDRFIGYPCRREKSSWARRAG